MSHASVPSAYRALLPGRASAGGFMSASFDGVAVTVSSSYRGLESSGCSFCNCLLSGAAIHAKFGTNHLKNSHKPRNEQSSVCVMGWMSFVTVFAVCFAN